MREIITVVFIILGTFFMFVAAVGINRMPDLYLRMSATTKAATLGAGFMLLAALVHFSYDIGVSSRALAIILFLLATAPVAAHMIGRAAYFNGIPLWQDSVVDELRGRYDELTHSLASSPEPIDDASDSV
ncbi:MAG TPA: monovalent cation/H(+) antiporter subunit G [Anaerolineae bacterium]|jgi:multicomponent Na+:H+ antiporter subunit G